jgi:hypothetical protein
MNITFLLVLLTLGDAGQINAAFVNTDSLNACQNKSKMLSEVISTAGTKILENRCFASEFIFSKFSHAQPSEAVGYNYNIVLNNETVDVIESQNKMECIVNKEKLMLTNEGGVHCTASTQQIIRDKE